MARLGFSAVLFIVGVTWALTMPLTKIAVSTGHQAFGLMLWQLVIGFALMSVIGLVRKRPLPWHVGAIRAYFAIALLGAVIPNSLTYSSAHHLPAGVMSIMISLVPMLAFPIALILSLDRFEFRRFAGLLLGLAAVLLLLLPGADLSGRLPAFWLCAYAVAALCYAFEGNYIARWGTAGCDPLEVLWGATIIGAVLVAPIVYMTGQWIPPRLGVPEQAQITVSTISILAYVGYVWLVNKAGPVFTVQVSYIVTVFGVIWSALILSERYTPSVWLSLLLMLAGMALVQPRRQDPGDTGRKHLQAAAQSPTLDAEH